MLRFILIAVLVLSCEGPSCTSSDEPSHRQKPAADTKTTQRDTEKIAVPRAASPPAAADEEPKAKITEATVPPIVRSVSLPSLALKGGEKAMVGPASWRPMANAKDDETLWIKGFEAKLVDEDTQKPALDYFCHVHLLPNGKASYERANFLGLHAGGNVLELPEGFGMPVEHSVETPIVLYGMSADYANKNVPINLRYEINVKYYDDKTAKELGLRALQASFLFLIPAPGHAGHDVHGWMVPPGRHTFRTQFQGKPVENEDAAQARWRQFIAAGKKNRVHHIHAHTHPYAEAWEIIDKTLGKTLAQGKIITAKGIVKHVDHYSSTDGFVVDRSHTYELTTTVNNTTTQPVDAMLTLRFFYRTL